MAISELITGTEAIGATEHSLATDTSYTSGDAQTTDGIYQLFVDLSDMVAGDEVRIRLWEKVLSSSTQRIADEWTFFGAQSKPVFVTPAVMLLHGWDWSATGVAGTITIDWSIRQVS